MNNKDTNIYYAYLRKSEESEDRQVQSIERQREEIMKLIELRNLTVVEFFEESRSAMIPNNRPEFTRMVKGIQNGKANGIITWHINRISRNHLESGIFQQLLSDEVIKRVVTHERDYLPGDNAIILSVESSLATQYSKDLKKAVKSGLENKAKQGIAPIKATIGYLNTKFGEHGSNYIIKDEDRFPVVRKIWDLMLTGLYTPTKVLEYINNDVGLRTKFRSKHGKETLSRSGLYKILNNIFYTGLFKYKGEIHQGIHEPMITLEEFDRVQRVLGKQGKPRNKKHHFEYTGLATCGMCGSAITATEKRKLVKSLDLYKTYTYYHCTKRKNGCETCKSQPYTLSEFEEVITSTIQEYSIPVEYKNRGLAVLPIVLKGMMPNEKEIVQYQTVEIVKLENELKNLVSLRVSENITDDEYIEAKKDRQLKILRLKENQKKVGKTIDEIMEEFDRNFTKVTDLKEIFENAENGAKKSKLLEFGSNHRINGKKLIFDKPAWLSNLSENKEGIWQEILSLELEKSIDTYNHLLDLRTICPLLCGLVDTIGTESKSRPPPSHESLPPD